MRCGCTAPCPACPGSEYVDYLNGTTFGTPINIVLGPVAVTRVLITRNFSIAAGLPGFGVIGSGKGSFSLFGENTGAIVTTQLILDGKIIDLSVLGNAPTFGIMATNTSEVDAFLGAQNNLAPGNHTLIYQVAALLPAGAGTLRVNSATMRTDLVRADNLTIGGGSP
jgi:hypothetical protein